MKKVFILNGVGSVGKGKFVEFVSKHIPTCKYSIADLPKEAATILGWDGGKTEKDRRFLSYMIDLATEYNDSPFRDVVSIVTDFKSNKIETDVLFVDMRSPKDIARAVKTFDAETVLLRNPRVKPIETNHADRNVENYKYDYIIENDGTLEQLENVAEFFVREIICWSDIPGHDTPLVLTRSDY